MGGVSIVFFSEIITWVKLRLFRRVSVDSVGRTNRRTVDHQLPHSFFDLVLLRFGNAVFRIVDAYDDGALLS